MSSSKFFILLALIVCYAGTVMAYGHGYNYFSSDSDSNTAYKIIQVGLKQPYSFSMSDSEIKRYKRSSFMSDHGRRRDGGWSMSDVPADIQSTAYASSFSTDGLGQPRAYSNSFSMSDRIRSSKIAPVYYQEQQEMADLYPRGFYSDLYPRGFYSDLYPRGFYSDVPSEQVATVRPRRKMKPSSDLLTIKKNQVFSMYDNKPNLVIKARPSFSSDLTVIKRSTSGKEVPVLLKCTQFVCKDLSGKYVILKRVQ